MITRTLQHLHLFAVGVWVQLAEQSFVYAESRPDRMARVARSHRVLLHAGQAGLR